MSQAVAIVGMSCRFPGGANTPAEFWQLLMQGRDAVTEIGPERFNREYFYHPDREEAGKSYTWAAGVLPDVRLFDAEFFGISPREAEQMDPQQRYLLELTWEALEHAGMPASSLTGSDMAVFLGISATDYASLRFDDPSSANAYFMTGNTLSVAANRISFIYDWHGPSMAVDTACSSSMVAFHEACRTVANGEAPMSVVAGINMLLSPFPFVGFSKASMLSPDGRCKAFDASGRGYVRAEGGAVLILKPLRKAIADGDSILAVVRSTGTNADGRTRGIALPNGEMQEALLRKVYQQAGVEPQDVSYLEAHGTGTAAGDPIETGAIGRVLGQGRDRKQPLLLGSVKSNIGHLEPASAMAGLVKSLLVLQHGVIPPSLHFKTPNPKIDFAGWNLKVVTEPTRLQGAQSSGGMAPIIGVNSFGFGGANAHAVLEAYRPAANVRAFTPALPKHLPPLVISAKQTEALEQLADRYADALEGMDAERYYHAAWTAAHRRDWLEERLMITPRESVQEVVQALRLAATGEMDGRDYRAAEMQSGKQAWVFSGNGAQWAGMMQDWLQKLPAVQAAMQQVDAVMQPLLGWSVLAYLQKEPELQALHKTEVAQPLLFAVQAAMVLLLQQAGVKPQAVLGHSVGEAAAVFAAGGMTLEQAAHVIVERSRAQALTEGQGGMAAVGMSAERAAALLAGQSLRIEVAAINSPQSVTLSGARDDLEKLGQELQAQGVFYRLLDLNYAFHSDYMAPVEAPLQKALADLNPTSGDVPFLSTVTGERLDTSLLVSDYWWHNVRQPVQFSAAVASALDEGITHFMEIGPHAILRHYLKECLQPTDIRGHIWATSRKGGDNASLWHQAVGQAILSGGVEAVSAAFPVKGHVVELPTYAWQHQPFWYPATTEGTSRLHGREDHPLLGTRLQQEPCVWEKHMEPAAMGWLQDHEVGGAIVFPAAGFMEMALAAAASQWPGKVFALHQLEIRRPLALHAQQSRTVRLSMQGDKGGFVIESRPRFSEEAWVTHCVGSLVQDYLPPEPLPEEVGADAAMTVDAAAHYQIAERLGLAYGESFQTVKQVFVGERQAVAELVMPTTVARAMQPMHLPPVLMDGAFQALFSLLYHQGEALGVGSQTYLPSRFGYVRLEPQAGMPARAVVFLKRVSARSLIVDMDVLDAAGAVVARLRDARFQKAELQRNRHWSELVLQWQAIHLPEPDTQQGRVVAVEADRLLAPCREMLEARLCMQAAVWRQVWQEWTQQDEVTDKAVAHDVAPQVEARFRQEMDALTQAGYARRVANGWQWTEAVPDAEAWLRDCLAVHPDWLPALLPVLQLRTQLASLWAGKQTAPLWEATTQPQMQHYLEGMKDWWIAQQDWLHSVSDTIARHPAHAVIGVMAPESAGMVHMLAQAVTPEQATILLTHPDAAVMERLQAETPGYPHVLYAAWEEYQPVDMAISPWLPVDRLTTDVVASVAGWLKPGASYHLWVEALPWGMMQTSDTDSKVDWQAAGLDVMEQVELAGWRIMRLQRRQDAANAGQKHSAQGTVLLLGEDKPLLTEAQVAWQQQGYQVVVHQQPLVASCQSDDWHAVAQQYATVDAIWFVYDTPPQQGLLLTQAALACVQAFAQAVAPGHQPFWVACQQRQGAAQAGVRGLLRVLANEYAELNVRYVERVGSVDWARVARVCQHYREERELHVTPTRIEALRMQQGVMARLAEGERVRLDTPAPGLLDRLQWQAAALPPLGDEQIRVKVHAAGLNFRDVMWAMGLLPDEAVEDGFAGPTLGMECAGEVIEVGAGCRDVAVGDRVLAFAPSCFSDVVTTSTTAVAVLPKHMDFAEAATIPAAFFTAYYALKTLANVQPGDVVLIHGAAGGVGLAAIQVAQQLGATVMATVGSADKRALVKALGVEHIFHSRDTSFADAVRLATQGRGVDVVLNSLAGQAMQSSLELLKPFGRFLELGKRDFYANSAMAMRALRNNISYFGIDADQLLTFQRERSQAVFAEMMHYFRERAFHALPYRLFGANQAVEAFRTMQQSRHSGKIIVQMQPAPTHAVPMRQGWQAKPDATYLLIGGLGGFGLATAEWLVAKGARSLILNSRRGVTSAEVEARLQTLRHNGVQVEIVAADASTEEGVSHLLQTAERLGMPPVRGILHTAMVLDDKLAKHMDAASVQRVWQPKAASAHWLDVLTRSMQLDWMVFYSSATTYLGNPGQANYVAANMVLEALAEARSAEGLPTYAMAWGPIDDAGYLVQHAQVKEALAHRLGKEPLTAEKALDVLGQVLARGQGGTYGVMPLEWHRIRKSLPLAQAPAYAWLQASMREEHEDHGDAQDFYHMAQQMDRHELSGLLQEMLCEQLAHILRLPADKMDVHKPIFEMGMDSLMLVELGVAIERQFGVELPMMALSDGMTVARLAERILDEVLAEKTLSNAEDADIKTQQTAALLARHAVEGESLTDAELQEQLREMEASKTGLIA